MVHPFSNVMLIIDNSSNIKVNLNVLRHALWLVKDFCMLDLETTIVE